MSFFQLEFISLGGDTPPETNTNNVTTHTTTTTDISYGVHRLVFTVANSGVTTSWPPRGMAWHPPPTALWPEVTHCVSKMATCYFLIIPSKVNLGLYLSNFWCTKY